MATNETAQPFALYNHYYDLVYSDKDYSGETNYVSTILKKFIPGAVNLLELGCGTGNFSEFLCNSGYKVTGVERSENMVKAAMAKNIDGFETIVGDAVDFSSDKKFDAAVSLFHVISYLTENESVLSCFKNVWLKLKPGGVFVFDVWFTPAVYTQQPSTRVKRISTDLLEITRIAEPIILYEKNIVQVDYQMIVKNKSNSKYEVLKEQHLMRHFSTPEILLFAELSGFKLLVAEEFLTAKKPGNNTWGVCYTLQKNG